MTSRVRLGPQEGSGLVTDLLRGRRVTEVEQGMGTSLTLDLAGTDVRMWIFMGAWSVLIAGTLAAGSEDEQSASAPGLAGLRGRSLQDVVVGPANQVSLRLDGGWRLDVLPVYSDEEPWHLFVPEQWFLSAQLDGGSSSRSRVTTPRGPSARFDATVGADRMATSSSDKWLRIRIHLLPYRAAMSAMIVAATRLESGQGPETIGTMCALGILAVLLGFEVYAKAQGAGTHLGRGQLGAGAHGVGDRLPVRRGRPRSGDRQRRDEDARRCCCPGHGSRSPVALVASVRRPLVGAPGQEMVDP